MATPTNRFLISLPKLAGVVGVENMRIVKAERAVVIAKRDRISARGGFAICADYAERLQLGVVDAVVEATLLLGPTYFKGVEVRSKPMAAGKNVRVEGVGTKAFCCAVLSPPNSVPQHRLFNKAKGAEPAQKTTVHLAC